LASEQTVASDPLSKPTRKISSEEQMLGLKEHIKHMFPQPCFVKMYYFAIEFPTAFR